MWHECCKCAWFQQLWEQRRRHSSVVGETESWDHGDAHEHEWCRDWGSGSTTNTWKKRCWAKDALEVSELWHIPALWEGGKYVRKRAKARSLCPTPLCPVISWSELFWEEKECDPESQGGWRSPRGWRLLHFWRWTQWQKWPKLFYKEHLNYVGTPPTRGPLVFGEGVQVKVMWAICTRLAPGAQGLCNIYCCWWKFDLQSPLSAPVPALGSGVQGCFSYLNNPKGTFIFTLVRLLRLTKISGVFFL